MTCLIAPSLLPSPHAVVGAELCVGEPTAALTPASAASPAATVAASTVFLCIDSPPRLQLPRKSVASAAVALVGKAVSQRLRDGVEALLRRSAGRAAAVARAHGR